MLNALVQAAALTLALAIGAPAVAQTLGSSPTATQDESNGPVRLRQAPQAGDTEATPASAASPAATRAAAPRTAPGANGEAGAEPAERPAPQGEFETFVQKLAGPLVKIQRFGSELLLPADAAAETSPRVPPDYLVKPGDELVVTLWGSVDADLRLRVDRSGRISIPRVGPVLVAGVRYADLNRAIEQRVGQVFRNFQVSVSLGQVRGQRVYVTGFVKRPGAYNVNGLATALQALVQAGGPSAAGSLRQVELVRGGQRVAALDLYQFMLRGDRGADLVLQPDDVVHVGPLGTQVALVGSVNRPAVFELLPGETAADLLRMAGGFTAVADRSRLALERLGERTAARVTQLAWPAGAGQALQQGDVLRAFSAVDSQLSVQRQNRRVKVEGEVARPGEYLLSPESTVTDAIAAAGGLTDAAFVYGTEFNRESVRLTQQQNFDRALRDLEVDLARAASSQRTASTEEAASRTAREAANNRLVSSLRTLRPTGRVVLKIAPGERALPPLALEDGDRLYIPPRPLTVGVFGSVFNGGSYLYGEGRPLGDYLQLAGGPTKGADPGSAFVVRADGSVLSALAGSKGFFGRTAGLENVTALPGDTVFVPEEMDKTTFLQAAKDWTQVLYQFGLGIAGIVAATR